LTSRHLGGDEGGEGGGGGDLSLDPPNKTAWYLPDDDGTSIALEENKGKINFF